MKLSILLLFAFAFSSCSDNLQEEEILSSDLFINCWKHSHEEDTEDDIDLYRTCTDREFPPSRFRKSIELRSDGTVTYLVASPVDAHYAEEGTWTFDQVSKILEIKDLKGKVHFVKEIISIKADLIELKELP